MTRTKSKHNALNTLRSKVFVPYCLPVCFVVAWYPGYEADMKQIRGEYQENTELPWLFEASTNGIVRDLKRFSMH